MHIDTIGKISTQYIWGPWQSVTRDARAHPYIPCSVWSGNYVQPSNQSTRHTAVSGTVLQLVQYSAPLTKVAQGWLNGSAQLVLGGR